jgi:CRISPR-associated protein Cas5d
VREFAADFEHEEDANSALERRMRELDFDCRAYSEDIGLMLYDVFSLRDRATGFQWLPESPELITARPIKGKTKLAAPGHAGVQAKPQALFFHAAVKQGMLDCHPDRVRFAQRVNN